MILSDKKILAEMKKGTIVITPFSRKFLGSNSYDVQSRKIPCDV
jgi:dCTP deaminase